MLDSTLGLFSRYLSFRHRIFKQEALFRPAIPGDFAFSHRERSNEIGARALSVFGILAGKV